VNRLQESIAELGETSKQISRDLQVLQMQLAQALQSSKAPDSSVKFGSNK
jgi:hypothetical protein